MGQYYSPMLGQPNCWRNFSLHYNKDGETIWNGVKLMEHSWVGNAAVEAICKIVYDSAEPTRIAWVGDYSDDVDECNGLEHDKIKTLWSFCNLNEGAAVDAGDFTIAGKYLVNNSKHQFVDCDKYIERAKTFDGGYQWTVHPLPLLTCIGNGMGGGDYNYPTDDSTVDFVGAWAWDEISIEDNAPLGFTEIEPIFKER